MSEAVMTQRLVDPIDAIAFDAIARRMTEIAPAADPTPPRALPTKVNLGRHLRYVRRQAGSGCFAFALLAAWDIRKEMACPYTPKLSEAPWMFLHRRRDMWEQRGGAVTRDGFIALTTGPEYGLLQEHGNPTEATQLIGYPASPWSGTTDLVNGLVAEEKVSMLGWTVEGINEAAEYRLDGLPQPRKQVNSATLMAQHAVGHPMRVSIPGHFLALVGYDTAAQTFTYVDSSGDKAHSGGLGTVSFLHVDGPKKPYFSKAEVIKIHLLRPDPEPGPAMHRRPSPSPSIGRLVPMDRVAALNETRESGASQRTSVRASRSPLAPAADTDSAPRAAPRDRHRDTGPGRSAAQWRLAKGMLIARDRQFTFCGFDGNLGLAGSTTSRATAAPRAWIGSLDPRAGAVALLGAH